MEGNSSNGAEFNKHKSRNPFPENSSNSRDGTSSNNGSQWLEAHKERRDHGKNRERSRDAEWNRERSFHGKNRDNFQDEGSRERFAEEQQPQSNLQPSGQQSNTFSSYNYSPTDQTYVDNNRHAMTMMPSYNLMAGLNAQWGVPPIDGISMTPNTMANATALPMATGMDMTQASGSGITPYAYMGMSADTNMFGLMGMGNYCKYGMMNGQENMMVGPVKEVVQLTKSVLYPPNPNAPPPTTRGKPLGCKTVFVGGLPEKATEEIIKEVFERCGEILTIRMSKKNFCHIRFASETFLENAIYFSGYRIKIENKDDAPFTGRLHVDYAQARDDQYEYECQQRALQREARHRERMEQDFFRSPTPPPVVNYSEHEATVLGEKLCGEETFQQAVFILVTWLERGECNKKNAASFYSMIQSTNSHFHRLMNEKLKYEDELKKARMMFKQQMQAILLQFNEISKVFNTACLQKVWDHLTKSQRKNIELWKKQTEEIKNAHVEEILNDRIEDEMDLSEDEENEENAMKKIQDISELKLKHQEELSKIRGEFDAIRCQLEAAENENMVMKAEMAQELEFKERDIQALKQALDSTTPEVKNLNKKRSTEEAEFKELRAFKLKKGNPSSEKDHSEINDNITSESTNTAPTVTICDSDARLISLISTFLHVHPFGANIDYICSYLQQIDSSILLRDVENLMKRFPTLFREVSTGIGASLGKKWKYLGFQSEHS